MGWGHCGTDDEGRPIGYAVEATCDQEGCGALIDRGLSYVCGSMHGGGNHGCGRYFCTKHLHCVSAEDQLCVLCAKAWRDKHPDPEAS